MNTIWQLEEAKKGFDVNRRGISAPCTTIELENQQKVMVISLDDYKNNLKAKNSLVDFFKESPLYGLPLELGLDKNTGRTIEL